MTSIFIQVYDFACPVKYTTVVKIFCVSQAAELAQSYIPYNVHNNKNIFISIYYITETK